MKKYLLPLLVGSVLSIFALFWTSPQTNAASIYDLNYQTTDELRISSYNNSVSIEGVEFKYQAMINGIYNDHKIEYDDGTSGGSQDAGGTKQQNIADQWNNSKERWAISQSCNASQPLKGCSIMLYFTANDSLSLQWNTNTVSVANPNTVKQIKISWYESIPGILVEYKPSTSGTESGNGYFGGAISGLTHLNTRVINYLAYVDEVNMNYPAGYEGNPIRDSIIPPVYFKPSISWSVDTTGVLRASYSNNADIKLNGFGNYFLTDSDEDWSDGNVLNQKVERPFWQYQYVYDKLPSAGYYKLRVSYEEGTSWEVAPDGYDGVETQFFRIYWDGESFIQGNNESCGGESEDYCDNTQGGNPFIEMLTEVNGNIYGLQAVITAPLAFITSIISYQSTCTPLVLQLPYMHNKSLSLPCMTPIYEQYFGALFEFYQTVLIALVSYYTFIRILHTVKDTQDPHINRIELAKL